MKKIISFLVFCLCLIVVGSLLSVSSNAQQKSSENNKKKKTTQKRTNENLQQMHNDQEQKNPPVRPPEELAYFQQLIEDATRNGIVRASVVVRDFPGAQDQLLRELAPFQVSLVTRFQTVPSLTLDVNAAALIYMRDSDLVVNVRPNLIGYPASGQTNNPIRSPEQLALFQRLSEQAQNNGLVRVIIELRASFTPEGFLTPAQRQAQRAGIRTTQENLLNLLAQFQVQLVTRYEFVPSLTLDVSPSALEFIKNSALVVKIQENQIGKPVVERSVSLIGTPNAWNRGYSGAGQAIAVLDTGVDKNHVFLRNKIISEACYSTNGSNLQSLCPAQATESTAPNSGLNCNTTIVGCDHGTHVAGIAAGNYPEANRYGVARDAQVIAIQVFSRDIARNEAVYTTDDLNRGLERVQALNGTYNIASVNLSLALLSPYGSTCDNVNTTTTMLVNNLRSYGIATIAASGNNGNPYAISHPACISTAVSVGATHDGDAGAVDTITDFSNNANFLSLLAPGSLINSSVPGGAFANFEGTSMAAPHVSGGWAILRQRVRDAPRNQFLRDRILRVFQESGRPIQDPRNGITRSRIQVDAALLRLTPPIFDYDNDDRTDVSVFRPSNGTWYLRRSTAGNTEIQFGQQGDIIAPGDYDGDGRTDVAIFRPSSNYSWYIQRSRDGFYAAQFGQNGDKIAPGDYDSDGRTEIAVVRPSTGHVYYLNVSTGASGGVFLTNTLSTDEPVPGDYDGDGRTDAAVFDPFSGTWYIRESQSNVLTQTQFGQSGDRTVQADYDGDGKTDIAVYRSGAWHLMRSNAGFTIVNFGASTDIPVPGDYDGDARVDVAVFRPSVGNWFIRYWTGALDNTVSFGQSGDVPTPSAYVRP